MVGCFLVVQDYEAKSKKHPELNRILFTERCCPEICKLISSKFILIYTE